jgi:hypothetical protein
MKNSSMGYLLFFIKFHVYLFFSNLFKRKKREYLMFFVGKFPNNFKHGFTPILEHDSLFRYSIGTSCILVRFTTTKNIVEIKEILNKIYKGYMDSYFLFDLNNNKHAMNLEKNHNKHLYTPINGLDLNTSLDNAQHFVEMINKQREIVISMLETEFFNNTDNQELSEVTMEQIDPILDKISEKGINSLTEEEKIILKKYRDEK